MGIRRWLSGTLRPDKLETDSVSTVEIGIDEIQNGEFTSWVDLSQGTDRNAAQSIQFTDGVSGKTAIFETLTGDFTPLGFSATVFGVNQSDKGVRFHDQIVVARDVASVVGSAEVNTPDGRSYDVSQGELKLTMDNGTYNVIADGAAVRTL